MGQFGEIQIRSLIGKGGETINDLRSKVGYTDLTITHKRGDGHGLLRITGDIPKAERLIREALEKKGCLFRRSVDAPALPVPEQPALPAPEPEWKSSSSWNSSSWNSNSWNNSSNNSYNSSSKNTQSMGFIQL